MQSSFVIDDTRLLFFETYLEKKNDSMSQRLMSTFIIFSKNYPAQDAPEIFLNGSAC